MGIKERQERDREAVRAPFSMRRASSSSPRATRTSRSERSPSASSTAPPPSTATSRARTTSSSRSPRKGSGCWATRGADDPTDGTLRRSSGVRAIFWRLYEFSRDQPQYFALMFVDRSVPRISREYERFAFAREMKHTSSRRCRACIDAGDCPPTLDPRRHARADGRRARRRGLRLSDRLAPGENADLLAADVLNLTLAGLRSGVALQSPGGRLPAWLTDDRRCSGFITPRSRHESRNAYPHRLGALLPSPAARVGACSAGSQGQRARTIGSAPVAVDRARSPPSNSRSRASSARPAR